jgi:hypothetical protein
VFPDTGLARRLNPDGRYASLAGLSVKFWTDAAGSSAAAIVTYPDQVAIGTSTVTSAADGPALVFGPDNVTQLYASIAGGPVVPVYPADIDHRVTDEMAAGDHVHAVVKLASDVAIMVHEDAPTDAVAGTGAGTTAADDLYVQTGGGPLLFVQTGTAELPEWTADAGTLRSGEGAPTDGVTVGDTGDYYSDTTAYGIDPATGWYVCTDGDEDTWAAVAVTVTAGADAPADGVVGTGAGTAGPGSLLIDTSTPGLYRQTGTLALPTWVALADAT